MHDFLALFKEDKLGAALVIIFFALVSLAPIQALRVWRAVREKKEGENDPVSMDSDKRQLLLMEQERERRRDLGFAELGNHTTLISTLQVEVKHLSDAVSDLKRRVDSGEQYDREFRERLLRLEVTANAVASDARAARKFLEACPVVPKEINP